MPEYFIVANSFAAPFFSDTSEGYFRGKNPKDVMHRFIAQYEHPCGLYSANLYENADAYHKNEEPLRQYLCNLELEKQRLVEGKDSYSVLHSFHNGKEFIEIDHERHYIKNPKEGKILIPIRE
ncbi:hypothetical protein ES703_22007 [subsurface metagenome]